MTLIPLGTRASIANLLGDFDSISRGYAPFRPIWPSLTDSMMSSRFEADEDDSGYTFTMTLPGFKKSEVKVSVKGGQLSVSGTSEKRGYKVGRSITLPSDVDLGSAAATLEDGMLTVSLKKRPEAQVTDIEVR